MQCILMLFLLQKLFAFTGSDEDLDDDDLDLIEENLGVKVKRKVSVVLK